jgi:protein subunit release factor B
MIEGCERMIRVSNNNNNNNNDSQLEEVRINPAMKRHYELEI